MPTHPSTLEGVQLGLQSAFFQPALKTMNPTMKPPRQSSPSPFLLGPFLFVAFLTSRAKLQAKFIHFVRVSRVRRIVFTHDKATCAIKCTAEVGFPTCSLSSLGLWGW